MIESILFGGNRKAFLPYSGPGNKQILGGNKTDGWLGIIDTKLMPTLGQIAAVGNLNTSAYTGTSNATPGWLKAVLNNKILFILNGPWGGTATYAAMYNAGFIFGVDGPGPAQAGALTAVNQLQYIEWTDPNGDSWLFKIRMLTDNSQTVVASSTDVTTTTIQDSEQYKLYSHILMNGQPTDGIAWDTLNANTDIHYHWTYGQTLISKGNVHAYPQVATPNAGQFYANSNAFSWTPVLELIRPDENLIFALNVKLTNPSARPVVTDTQTTTTLRAPGDLIVMGTPAVPLASTASSPVVTSASNVYAGNAGVYSIVPTVSK